LERSDHHDCEVEVEVVVAESRQMARTGKTLTQAS
jgi:hypothetical protein